MGHFFTSWLRYARRHQEVESSIASMAFTYGMGRRRDFRICYPPWGDLGYLPQIFVCGEPLAVHDISMGGVGLVPSETESSGEHLSLELRWPDNMIFQTKAKAIANYKHRTHLQFRKLDPSLKDRLRTCLSPKLVGQRFQLIRLKNSPFRCVEDEVWVSLQSETLLIQDKFGVLRTDEEEIHIEVGHGIYIKTTHKRQLIKDREPVAALLICLSNFEKTSQHLEKLKQYIYNYWQDFARV